MYLLQKPVLKHHTLRAGELRFILPALSPEQRDYRVFIDRL